jgi:prepilin-type N-terminal cleavage/methylation domain-containing protein
VSRDGDLVIPVRAPKDLRSEEGYTLTELLVAMSVGLIVLMAAFMLIDRASTVSAEIANRQDAVQRGRIAIERMTRQIRSQVCLGETTEPITYGDANTITFYADLSDGSTNVERRTIQYDPATKNITEYVYPGTGIYPDLAFSSTPAETRVLVNKAERVTSPATNFLRYYAFNTGGQPGDLQELPVPLSAANASRTVMVKLAFVSMPDRLRPEDRESVTFYNDVYVRLADPSRPTEGPRCI